LDFISQYLAIIDICGQWSEIGRRSRWQQEQRWREVYAARLHASTGKWRWGQLEWHVFSFHHAPALEGTSAVEGYLQTLASELIVIPEQHSHPTLPAIHLSADRLPQFQDSGFDVMVWPPDLGWTMAFTHEEGSCGPYFARREWMAKHPDWKPSA